tara:strand:- start:89 stop:529 length:441 start_codon:yes stop_codon:yes gene_type:complete
MSSYEEEDSGLRYFDASEFGEWWPYMNKELLKVLDEFRHLWGAPVHISPARGALGRKDQTKSFHNFSRYKEVLAADIFPEGLDEGNFRDAVSLAKEAGAKGIGLYPEWRYGEHTSGMHLDVGVRGGDGMGYWSRVGGRYYAIDKVL